MFFLEPGNVLLHSIVPFSLVLTVNTGFALQEKAFLKKLKFRLNAPTPYVFMLRFLKAAQSETKVYKTDNLISD